MKKSLVVFIFIIAFITLLNTAFAGVLSDDIFNSASVTLSSNKKAVFSAETRSEKNTIKITQVVLQEQNSDGNWVFVCNLTRPTYESHNNIYYGTSKYYTSSIGTGTFRLYVTFWADGYTVSRYSNSKTY